MRCSTNVILMPFDEDTCTHTYRYLLSAYLHALFLCVTSDHGIKVLKVVNRKVSIAPFPFRLNQRNGWTLLEARYQNRSDSETVVYELGAGGGCGHLFPDKKSMERGLVSSRSAPSRTSVYAYSVSDHHVVNRALLMIVLAA